MKSYIKIQVPAYHEGSFRPNEEFNIDIDEYSFFGTISGIAYVETREADNGNDYEAIDDSYVEIEDLVITDFFANKVTLTDGQIEWYILEIKDRIEWEF